MKNIKIALILGVTEQNESFLAELLLEKGYEVHRTIRCSSMDYRERIAPLEGRSNFHLHYADHTDLMSILQVVSKVRSTEIYNLALHSHVQVSFDSSEFTAKKDGKDNRLRRKYPLEHGAPEWYASQAVIRKQGKSIGMGSQDKFEGVRLVYEDFLHNPIKVEREVSI